MCRPGIPSGGGDTDLLEVRQRAAALHDLYGPLLTARQRELLRLYYDEDLSLGEIAAQAGVSRQAVHDLLRRALAALEQYDRRLGLLDRLQRRRARAVRVRALLRRAAGAAGDRQQRLLRQAEVAVSRLAED